jgi:hypothetical protein
MIKAQSFLFPRCPENKKFFPLDPAYEFSYIHNFRTFPGKGEKWEIQNVKRVQ